MPIFLTGERNSKPLQYSCHENPINSAKRQKDMTPEEEPPRSGSVQYATGEERRNEWMKRLGQSRNDTRLSGSSQTSVLCTADFPTTCLSARRTQVPGFWPGLGKAADGTKFVPAASPPRSGAPSRAHWCRQQQLVSRWFWPLGVSLSPWPCVRMLLTAASVSEFLNKKIRWSYGMRQVLGAGALGRPRGMGWRGRREGGSGWGTHVNPWLILVNVWQKPPQYCKVVSLQLIKINGKKKEISHCHCSHVPWKKN